MNILVTGATGFIGSCLVKRLLSDHVLYCPTRKAGLLPVHPQVHAIELDLADAFDAGRLPASMDAIIHLAQSRHFRRFPDHAKDIFQVNTQSTLQLLEYGRQAKIRVFLCASSGGVCGYQPRPIVETDPPELMNFYLASKYAAECLVNAYSDYFATVNLRYFFVFGEGQRDMFMPALEVVRQETFNVAGAETTTILDLAELIGSVTGSKPVYSFEPEKGPMAMVANIEKMKLKLGVSPKVSLKEGLDRLVQDLTREGKGAPR